MLGAVGRLGRDRLGAAAAVVLAVVVVVSSLFQSATSRQLSQVLDTNWRGAYDILVRPGGQDLGAASTGGFVEGNFVAVTGQGGISLAQLKKIRAISGVGLAAPIGLVGQVGYDTAAPSINIPDRPKLGTSALPLGKTLYRIGFTLTLSDAGGNRVVDSQTIHAVLQRQTGALRELVAATDDSSSATSSPDLGITFSGPTLPSFSSAVIAVDPVAEMQLLGDAGKFLTPLTTVPKARQAKALADSAWLKSLPNKFYAPVSIFQSAGTSTDGSESTVGVPLLVNDTAGARIKLTLTVDRATKKVTTLPATVHDTRVLEAGASYVPLGTVQKDLTSLLVPFATGNLSLPWPGSAGFDIELTDSNAVTNLIPELAGRPAYTVQPGPAGLTMPSFRVTPKGLVTIDGKSVADDPAARAAGVQSYRSTLLPPSGTAAPETSTMNLPIASFTLKDLDFGASGLSYVPFGAYDPARTTLLAAPVGGKPIQPDAVVTPNPSGLDFISPVPGAITDLGGAQALRGDAPIDAVRVRVAGIGAYTPAAQATVVQVADRIAAVGLSVSIVAGASPQPVAVYVPDYRVAADGTTSDLGWVRQDWTTLGAAVRVQKALTGLSLTMLIVALAVGALLYVGCAVAGRPGRVAAAGLLATLGWERRRVRDWFLGPHLVVLAFMVALTLLLALTSGLTGLAVWCGLGAVTATAIGVAVVAATTAGGPVRARGSGRRRQGRSSGVGSPFRVGVRQVLARPGLLGARTASFVTVAVSCALVVATIGQARVRAGATRLAGAAIDRTSVGNLALAVLILLAGILLTGLARRVEGQQGAAQRRMLTAAGWTAADLRRRSLADTVLTTAAAVLPVLAVAVGLAPTAATPTIDAGVIIAVAALAGCAAIAIATDHRTAISI